MKITVRVEAKKAFWLMPFVRTIAVLNRIGIVPIVTAKRWATSATNHAVKYRVDKGQWRKFESPIIPFGDI